MGPDSEAPWLDADRPCGISGKSRRSRPRSGASQALSSAWRFSLVSPLALAPGAPMSDPRAMTEAAEARQGPSEEERPHFRALLTPHRSLSPTGFMILMSAVCAVSFGTGLLFYLLGAWPVVGFMGLDVALIYIAFKLNYRSGRLYETVDLQEDALTVTRVQPSGKAESWSFNPYWVRLSLIERIGRSSELSLNSHGGRLVFASFLSDHEREDFAQALSAALREARAPVSGG